MKTIFSITSDRGLGGISASLLTYSRAMALAGIRHIIAVPEITPVYDNLAAMDNVELIPMSSAKLRLHALSHYRFSPQLRAHMKSADCIFIHNAKHATVPADLRGKAYVINHNGKTRRLSFAPNIIFLNKSARDNFLEAFPTLTTHHLVMGHGFDVSPEIKRTHDEAKPVQIISAGRLMEKKGYRELVETARLLKADKVNCHINIYGEGPDEALLKERISDYGLDNITIHPWTDNLRAALAASDIFCTPSHGESFPLVIGEALEAGLAIASTSTNGAREYFSYTDEDKPIGLLSDIKDFESMALILKEIVCNHQLRFSMNKNARAFLLNNFSLDILAQKFARLCDETKKRPRVFIATQTFSPRIGGMENVMKSLAEKFSQTGHNVTVLPNRAYKVPSAFRVISLGMIKPLRIIAKRLVLKLMLRDEDVVICDSWKSINVITRRFNGRMVVLAHGQEYLKGDKHYDKIQSALTRASAVIASSDFTAGLIRQRYEIAPSKLKVIPPTYMLEADGVPDMTAKDKTKPVKLISLCRLDKRKGLMQSLTALHNIGAKAQEWYWDIIGDGPEAQVLKKEAARLGLSDKIKFHHNVCDAEKAEKLAAADLFVMPSYQVGGSVEGFGISYVEAAQYGLPAIAGIAGGSVSAVKDGETGWCIDTTDRSQIEATLSEAINASEERDRRGKAAYERYQNEFMGDRVFDDFIAHAKVITEAI